MTGIDPFLLLDGITDPLFLVSRAGRIAFANQAGRNFAGPLLDEGPHPACVLFCGRQEPGSDCAEDCLVKKALAQKQGIRFSGCGFFAANLAEGIQEVGFTPLAGALAGEDAVLLQLRLKAPVCKSTQTREGCVSRQEHDALKLVLSQVKRAKDEWIMAMDVVSDLVLLLDQEGRVHRCNKAVSDFFGKNYPELVGYSWESLCLEAGLGRDEGRGGYGFAGEVVHGASGRVFQENCYFLEATGTNAQRITTLHNITELRRTQEDIEKNRKRLEGALREISSMIQRITAGKGGDFFFTLPPEHGSCWQMINCAEKDCPCYGREPLQCWTIEGVRCRTAKDNGNMGHGQQKCLSCRFYREAADDPVAQIGMQFSQMMRIIEKKNQELRNAYEEMKATQSQFVHQEKMASIGQLAAGVAHEINNPIGFVTSNLGTLQKYVARLEDFLREQARLFPVEDKSEPSSEIAGLRRQLKIDHILEDLPDLIAESLDGVERVRKIVQNLKSFSRIDQSDYSLADINQCIDDTLNIIWNELKYKCTIKKDYGELPRIKCYPQQLNQVFMNLLVNAAHAIKEKGEITITTRATGGEVSVAISDTGVGIAPENLSRIFEPFFTTKEVGKGTGLGLSITYDIVTKKHGGRIEVKSEQGKGSTFVVTLPAITE